MHYLYLMSQKYGALDTTNGYIYFKLLFKMKGDENYGIALNFFYFDIGNIQISEQAFDDFFQYENSEDNQDENERAENNLTKMNVLLG